MEAVIAPEEKRITLDAEKRGVQGIAMYLPEKQVTQQLLYPCVLLCGECVLSNFKCNIFGVH